MQIPPLQTNLTAYTVVLPADECLPKGAPKEKLELMLHHAQVEAQEAAYRKIEQETGLVREQLIHLWSVEDGTSRCVFMLRETTVQTPHPGISVQLG